MFSDLGLAPGIAEQAARDAAAPSLEVALLGATAADVGAQSPPAPTSAGKLRFAAEDSVCNPRHPLPSLLCNHVTVFLICWRLVSSLLLRLRVVMVGTEHVQLRAQCPDKHHSAANQHQQPEQL